MSEFRDEALKKLQSEFKSGKYDKYGQVMKADVLRQLEDFVEQEPEFAQAVAQGGTFEDCMKAVAKSCGQSLSDVEAYRRAVAKFGVWFTQVQNDFNRMMEALREVRERDPETGEKLKTGAVTLLKNQVARLGPEEE